MRRVSDFVSLFTYAIVAYPLMRYLETFDPDYLKILIAIFAGGMLVKASRMIPAIHESQLRPAGACDCSILNDGGSAEGRIGMPSGHVFMATLTIGLLWAANPRATTIWFGAAAVAAISAARVAKGCHTAAQTAAGAAAGVAFAALVSRIAILKSQNT